MKTKTIEIRDSATFIPALAIRLDPACERDRYLIARAGYGLRPEVQADHVIFVRLSDGKGSNDVYSWGDRTYANAHQYIAEHFDELASGAVVDVEFILGEKAAPSESEQATT